MFVLDDPAMSLGMRRCRERPRMRWDVEHHDVVRVVGQDPGEIAAMDRRSPALDQCPNLFVVEGPSAGLLARWIHACGR
jgi:hypothetical protein